MQHRAASLTAVYPIVPGCEGLLPLKRAFPLVWLHIAAHIALNQATKLPCKCQAGPSAGPRAGKTIIVTSLLEKNADGSVSAPFPHDEDARLEALHDYCILDTGKDPRFDRITALVAETLSVPVVVISLVDRARQWFKSIQGADVAEIDRRMGFCAHTIVQPTDAPMVIIDAVNDPRFATNPLVVGEPFLRFYAGAPLIDAQGLKLGSLCVHDLRPRPDWSAADSAILAQFAAITMDQIAFQRAEHERAILLDEMAHRVKNVIAVISGIASLSGRNHPAAADYLIDFRGRLAAIATAHQDVVTGSWSRANANRIITDITAPYQSAGETRVDIRVEDCLLPAASAQTLALVTHELLTNAVKYGALSVDSGTLLVTGEREGEVVAFVWRERGGPEVQAPQHKGFGSVMLERAVKAQGGTAHLDWDQGRPDRPLYAAGLTKGEPLSTGRQFQTQRLDRHQASRSTHAGWHRR